MSLATVPASARLLLTLAALTLGLRLECTLSSYVSVSRRHFVVCRLSSVHACVVSVVVGWFPCFVPLCSQLLPSVCVFVCMCRVPIRARVFALYNGDT